jgi:subtilisin family serine protease
LFRDLDGNGVMEFDAKGAAWSRELDFLSWAPDGGKPTLDLPAGTKARLSLQWREAHDPIAGRPGEDPYLKPLADLRIVLVYQPDPNGAKQPADDLDVIAQSVGQPARLEATPSSAVYEQTLELRVTKPGRYAVRIEGTAPTSTRSREDPSIPAARKTFELRPRLFVETLEGPGRVLLRDFTTAEGAMGMPADSRNVITVGAADHQGRPEPYSASGSPLGAALLVKPDVLSYDQIETPTPNAAQGVGVATGFAAGVAALGPTLPEPTHWRQGMGVPAGGLLRVPADWPRK